MYVCICHGVTDGQINSALDAGARSIKDINQQLCVGSCCGKCVRQTRELVRAHQQANTAFEGNVNQA